MPSHKSKPAVNPWDETAVKPLESTDPSGPAEPTATEAVARLLTKTTQDQQAYSADRQFDLEGLMTDFPTARDLERFVYDETGQVLNLKGRANKLKYQVAMDVLNGETVDTVFFGKENPYVDKADMVPTETLKEVPDRDPGIPARGQVQNLFNTHMVPHPDADLRAAGKRCSVTFRKYKNGLITYDVLGPVNKYPFGEKIDKFGKMRPEVIKWNDPRTGEQIVQRTDGSFTPQGKRLRALMQQLRVNKTNQWDVWVDRDFVSLDSTSLNNPWAIDSE